MTRLVVFTAILAISWNCDPAISAALLTAPIFAFWCACCGDCRLCLEEFAIPDGSDISTGTNCGWTKVSGTSSISSGRVELTGTGSIVRCNTEAPDGHMSASLSVDTSQLNAGDEFRVTIDNDGTDYHAVEVKWGPSGYVKLLDSGVTLKESTGDIDGFNVMDRISLAINVDDRLVASFHGLAGGAFWVDCTPHGGTKCTIETGSTFTGTLSVGEFTLSVTDPDSPCGPSLTWCGAYVCNDGGETPTEYEFQLSGVGNGVCDCSVLNATWYEQSAAAGVYDFCSVPFNHPAEGPFCLGGDADGEIGSSGTYATPEIGALAISKENLISALGFTPSTFFLDDPLNKFHGCPYPALAADNATTIISADDGICDLSGATLVVTPIV